MKKKKKKVKFEIKMPYEIYKLLKEEEMEFRRHFRENVGKIINSFLIEKFGRADERKREHYI